MRRLLVCVVLTALTGYAQSDSGVAAPWDVKNQVVTLIEDTKKLEPLLARMDTAAWTSKGASPTFGKQRQSAVNSLRLLALSANKLSADPERLSYALETVFGLEKLETLLNSLNTGVRRYADSTLASEVNVLLASTSNHRTRLQQHAVELAVAREEQIQIMDQEAQRCRGILSQTGASNAGDRKTQGREKK